MSELSFNREQYRFSIESGTADDVNGIDLVSTENNIVFPLKVPTLTVYQH